MLVVNHHERDLAAAAPVVGALINGLASANDRLWPHDRWPPMRLDRPLQPGATGGHGPIRYRVESYRPGEAVTFRFLRPTGFDGTHTFAVQALPSGSRLSHSICMTTSGKATWAWRFVYGPLHDALLEDALDRAAQQTGGVGRGVAWSRWVRLLRWVLARARQRRRTAKQGF